MKKTLESPEKRRALVTGMSAAVAGLAIAAASTASAQTDNSGAFTPARHDLDAWMGELGGNHRVFIDTASAQGGADALRYGSNILNAHQNAYAGSDADYAMVICYRHLSTPFGFNDAMWAKYGEQFKDIMSFTDPATGAAPVVNLMNQGNGPTTISTMGNRGVKFAICSSATRFVAGRLAAVHGGTAEDMITELMANAVPNSRFVPAGVMAMTRAQEYRYSLLYAG